MKLALGFVLLFAACSSKSAPVEAPVEAPSEASSEASSEPASSAAARWELDGHRLVVSQPIGFEKGSAVLASDAAPALGAIKAYLEEKSSISQVRIEGHADEQGLSEARAMAVARWLVEHGVACERVLPVGFGVSKPMYGDERDERIEVVNAMLRGRAIGGMPADGGGAVAGDPCS